MKITIQNLGPITETTINIRKMTLLLGQNNSGKTYLSYAIWGVINHLLENTSMDFPRDGVKSILKSGVYKFQLELISKNYLLPKQLETYEKNLEKVFSAPAGSFPKFKISIDEPDLIRYNPDNQLPKVRLGETEISFNVIRETNGNSYSIVATQSGNDIKEQVPPAIMQDMLETVVPKAFTFLPFVSAFSITSERTGVTLFYRNLDYKKSAALDYILNSKSNAINPFELLEKTASRYALPIQANIDYARNYEDEVKKNSFFFQDIDKYKDVIDLWEGLLGGKIELVNGQTMFAPFGFDIKIPFHLASSSVKSLFLIDAYFRHSAQTGDILFIDEPELNLSPENQVKMARFLAKLVQNGIYVFVTTHSDYICREINLLLGKELEQTDISVYCAYQNGDVKELEVDADGFSVDLIDNVIEDQIERGY